MTVEKKLLTQGATHGRTGKALSPKGIVVHYVGNPSSTAQANRNWFENGAGGAYTSAHYIVGLNGEVLLLIPENERAQHAGKAYAPQYESQAKQNNSSYIGIECCHPNADGMFNSATMASLVELCADICKRYGFDPADDIFRHYDVTGKKCPLYYVNNPNAWAGFLAAVDKKLDESSPKADAEKITVELSTVKLDLFGIKIVEIPGWMSDGVNYVGVRALLESMEYALEWDARNKTVLVSLPDGD